MTSHPDPLSWQRPAAASLVDPEDDPPSTNYAGDFETTAIPRYDSTKSSAGQPFGLISDPEPLPYVQPGGRHSVGSYSVEPTEIGPDAGDPTRDRRGTQDLGLLLLRVVVGALFIGHGLQKAFGLWGGPGFDGFEKSLTDMGFQHAGTDVRPPFAASNRDTVEVRFRIVPPATQGRRRVIGALGGVLGRDAVDEKKLGVLPFPELGHSGEHEL